MDATPVTLGQEFGGYATAVEIGVERLQGVLPRVGELPLGGTAVGTGINAPKTFAKGAIGHLSETLGLPLVEARDHFEAQASRDALVEASGVLRTIAVSLYKCANDLRWMASGPRTGLAEIRIPDLQPGSSIMPGKVNPVVPEAVCQVVSQVIGNDAAVAFGGRAGNLELNVMLPVIARNILESIRLLANVSRIFADRTIVGIEADVERCKAYAESSPSIGTSLNPYIGYERAAEVIKESTKTGRSIRELVPAARLDERRGARQGARRPRAHQGRHHEVAAGRRAGPARPGRQPPGAGSCGGVSGSGNSPPPTTSSSPDACWRITTSSPSSRSRGTVSGSCVRSSAPPAGAGASLPWSPSLASLMVPPGSSPRSRRGRGPRWQGRR
jgi:hypothetical protein